MNPDSKPYQTELRRLAEFAEPDPRALSGGELDAMISDMGGDYGRFCAKLDQKLRLSELKSADEEMSAFHERLRIRSGEISRRLLGSADAMRREIDRRLSGPAGKAAQAYFRMYEGMPDEDLTELLAELEILEEDGQRASSGG